MENVNRANLEAGWYIHTLRNIVPRVRQYVKQLNATLVSVYDPSLELDFVNPVPEDVQQKLNEIKGAVNQWLTIDEARAAYGMDELPDGLGSHIILNGIVQVVIVVAIRVFGVLRVGGRVVGFAGNHSVQRGRSPRTRAMTIQRQVRASNTWWSTAPTTPRRLSQR